MWLTAICGYGQARIPLDGRGKVKSSSPTERPQASTLYTQADTVRYRELVVEAYRSLQKDSFLQAKSCFEQALKAIPRMDSNAEVCYELGQLEEREGHYAKAVDCYTRAVKRNNHYLKAYLRRGGMYLLLGDDMTAVKDFDNVISIDNTNNDAYFFRGCAYANMGRYELAAKDLSLLLQRNAADERTLYTMALVEIQQNKLEDALLRMNGLIWRYPKETLYYKARAEINEKRGTTDMAEKDWQQAVALAPADADIAERYAQFLLRQNRRADAMKVIDGVERSGVPSGEVSALRQRIKRYRPPVAGTK